MKNRLPARAMDGLFQQTVRRLMTSNTNLNIAAHIDHSPVSALQYRVIVLCALVVLFDGLDTQVIGYLGPALSAEWSITRAQLGPVFSASLVGLMCGLLIIGLISDRIGRRLSIIFSVSLFALCTLLTAAAQGVTDLMVYRFLAGIGLGGAMPNALALTGEYCPKGRRATLVIIMFCGFSLGSILGGLVAASLLSILGWRAVFLVGGMLPLLLLPWLLWQLPESLYFLVQKKQNEAQVRNILQQISPGTPGLADASLVMGDVGQLSEAPVRDLFAAGRGPGTLMLWVVFFMNLMVFYFLQNWLPTIFSDAGLPIERAVLMTTLISVGGIVAGLISGPLMDRHDAYRVLGSLYLGAMLLVAAIGWSSPALLALVTFGAGFCVSGAQKSMNALAVIFYPPQVRSTGVGWALGIGRFGSILGPVVAGWLLSLGWSAGALLQLAALPMLLAAGVIFAMGLRYGSGSKSMLTVTEAES
ncbi:MAG: MFS transporter [Pseudomonadales bacterium]|nr:MFS transporter [Pseudomonadales bacterium]